MPDNGGIKPPDIFPGQLDRYYDGFPPGYYSDDDITIRGQKYGNGGGYASDFGDRGISQPQQQAIPYVAPQSYGPSPQQIPGDYDTLASQIAGRYYTRGTLSDSGWTDNAADYVSNNIPYNYLAQTTPYQANNPTFGWGGGGGYYGSNDPKEHGRVDINYQGGIGTTDLTHLIEHEAEHSWEAKQNPGGSMNLPEALRGADFNRVIHELMPGTENQDVNGLVQQMVKKNTWKDDGSESPVQLDSAHYVQMLMSMGFRPEDIPKWYKDTYMTEYK